MKKILLISIIFLVSVTALKLEPRDIITSNQTISLKIINTKNTTLRAIINSKSIPELNNIYLTLPPYTTKILNFSLTSKYSTINVKDLDTNEIATTTIKLIKTGIISNMIILESPYNKYTTFIITLHNLKEKKDITLILEILTSTYKKLTTFSKHLSLDKETTLKFYWLPKQPGFYHAKLWLIYDTQKIKLEKSFYIGDNHIKIRPTTNGLIIIPQPKKATLQILTDKLIKEINITSTKIKLDLPAGEYYGKLILEEHGKKSTTSFKIIKNRKIKIRPISKPNHALILITILIVLNIFCLYYFKNLVQKT